MNKSQSLTPDIINIVQLKHTERPFSGEKRFPEKRGTFLCRQCGIALFRASAQFDSGCGWPSFDDQLHDRVLEVLDADGIRTEIVCKRCNAHLGHVFYGEGFTKNNKRHCVNSLSLEFVEDLSVQDTEEAIIAGGCFWGVEYFFQQLSGVLKTEVGYLGGTTAHPTYEEVCAGLSHHVEAVRILFDTEKTNYRQIIQYFFEIHDPTQTNGQGPDIGEQYLSVIYYYHEDQKRIAMDLINQLEQKNYFIATQLKPVSTFWSAETYHQEYYVKNKKLPYCHHYVKRF